MKEMMDENKLTLRPAHEVQPEAMSLLTAGQIALIKQTVAQGATDDELRLFLEVARATELNPFAKEIYFIKYKMRDGSASVAMPVGIDGLRRKAAESGDYAGQVGPFWCGDDGEWKDVWFSESPPAACKVGVLRHGNPEPTWGIVKWSEFSKAGRTGGKFWDDRPTHMMAIRAESHALRKAAPRLVEKLQAAGTQVIDADYLIAKAEQAQRQNGLPKRIPPGDMQQELYGSDPGGRDQPKQASQSSVQWTKDDLAKLAAAIAGLGLSSSEWRKLLGLGPDAQAGAVVALGTADEVIAMIQKAFSAAVTDEVADNAIDAAEQLRF